MMAGLLDMFSDDSGLLGLHLLAAAGPQARPTSFGQRLLGGIGGYKAELTAEEERKQKKAMQELQMGLLGQQIEETKAQAQQRMAAIEETKRKAAEAEALRQRQGLFLGGLGGTQPAGGPSVMAGSGQRTPDANASMLGAVNAPVARQFDLAQAIELFGIDKAKELAGSGTWGMPERSASAKGIGPDGREYEYQIDKQGRPMGQGLPQYRAPIQVSQGDRNTFLDAYGLKPITSFGINQSADSKASNAVQWANHGLAKQRLAQEGQGQLVDTANGYVRVGRDNTATPITVGGQPLMGKGGANMTEDQGKATGWLVQATNAYSNMQAAMKEAPSAAKPGFNDALAAIPSFGLTGGIANTMRGADRQRFMQSASSMSEALLRAATGAGVNRDEAEQKIKELTPQFGDGEAVVAQKMASIPLYIESLKVRAGPGAPKAASIFNGKSAPNLFDSADAILRGGR